MDGVLPTANPLSVLDGGSPSARSAGDMMNESDVGHRGEGELRQSGISKSTMVSSTGPRVGVQ